MSATESFLANDGTKIIYRSWKQEDASAKVLVLLHRGHEHSERMTELATYFFDKGFHVFAWDARGNGLSEGPRDDADNFMQFSDDLQLFIKQIESETNQSSADMCLIASSMGAVIAANWIHAYGANVRALVLATPALKIQLYVPFGIQLLTLARKLNIMPRVTSYVKSRLLTHDEEQQTIYNQDPLISKSISTDLLIDTYKTGCRLMDDANTFTLPVLMLSAGKDWIVSLPAQRKFYERLSSNWKEWRFYPDAHHALFHEENRKDVFADCLDFISRAYEQPTNQQDFSMAHVYGTSKDKSDAAILPNLNPTFKVTKWLMQTLGRSSNAIKIGLDAGFDSGESLDCVYQNTPKGSNAFGKFVDKVYLSSPAWEGIRQRKIILSTLLNKYLKASRSKELKVLDIAAGNGRYLLETLASVDKENLHVELRDYSEDNIRLMKEKVETLEVTEQVNVVQADAFSSDSYTEKSKYNVAVVSGLFELFSDNALISSALAGMAKELKKGGYLFYTNQPWHPQQEFIAKTLTNHQGEPWVMRCRSQAEMDQLVISAGFDKVETHVEPQGIFSVSVARKR